MLEKLETEGLNCSHFRNGADNGLISWSALRSNTSTLPKYAGILADSDNDGCLKNTQKNVIDFYINQDNDSKRLFYVDLQRSPGLLNKTHSEKLYLCYANSLFLSEMHDFHVKFTFFNCLQNAGESNETTLIERLNAFLNNILVAESPKTSIPSLSMARSGYHHLH